VLILYPYDERIPATAIAGEAARNRLLEATSGKIDLFSEFLDLGRFPEDAHIDRMARYLAQKYAERRPDVVIAISDESASFIVSNRNAIAPDAKIIFCGFNRAVASKMELPGDVVGAFSEFDVAKTLEMARVLQPKASHLFIISGSANFDRSGLASVRADLAVASKHYQTTYLTDLTIEEFVERAAHVPADSIVLVLSVGRDRTGRNFIPRQALEQIAATAGAPVYGPYDTYIGHGAVGASASTVESIGRTAADLAVDALAGKPITETLGVVRERPSSRNRRQFQGKDPLGRTLACDPWRLRGRGAAGHRHHRAVDRASSPLCSGRGISLASSRTGAHEPISDRRRLVGIDRP
jgi:ABC-type uncharacterized transport system substrate-binding protein